MDEPTYEELKRRVEQLEDARIRSTDKVQNHLRKEFLAQSEIFHYENWLAFKLEELRSALLDAVSELEHYNPDMSRALYRIAMPDQSTQDKHPAAAIEEK